MQKFLAPSKTAVLMHLATIGDTNIACFSCACGGSIECPIPAVECGEVTSCGECDGSVTFEQRIANLRKRILFIQENAWR
jgi:hypothetical protein